MRLILTACLAAAAFVVTAAMADPLAASRQLTTYRVTPEVEGGELKDLRLDVSFQGDLDGSTKIVLPDRWSGSEDLWRAVHDVTAEGASVKRTDNTTLILTHAPGARVRLTYHVRQDFQGQISVLNGAPYRPATQSKWFTAVGWTLFPEIDSRVNTPVQFEWGQAPAGWAMASDLDHKASKPRLIDDLYDAVLVGGEHMKVLERQAAGGRIRIAFHGDWAFSPEALADLQGRIAETSSDFWKDRGEEFFVAVTPLTTPDGAMVQYGVGLGDAFSLWATPNVDEPALRHILAHEHQHAWFPSRMGGVRGGPDEPLDYWLSEGFTDFYTLRILLRSGAYSLEDFTADYNRILRAYSASPVRDAPNGLVAAKFWEDRNVADLPYQRGLLVAALWDDRLRRESRGRRDLDDVVIDMKDRAQGRDRMEGGAIANLKVSYRALGGGDLNPDIKRYVDGGQRVMLPADLFGDCAVIKSYDQAAFDRGFDPDATSRSKGVVAGVDPRGPAYAAGLRNGMRILSRDGGDDDDSSVDLVYRIKDAAGERTLRYKPTGARKVLFQQIVLTPGMTAEKRARCVRVMAGE